NPTFLAVSERLWKLAESRRGSRRPTRPWGSSPGLWSTNSWGSRRATRPGGQIPRYLAGYRRPRATHEAFATSRRLAGSPDSQKVLNTSDRPVDLDEVWRA